MSTATRLGQTSKRDYKEKGQYLHGREGGEGIRVAKNGKDLFICTQKAVCSERFFSSLLSILRSERERREKSFS